MRRSMLLALLCGALHAGTAAAQSAPPMAAKRTAHLVLGLGIDGGSDKIGTVYLSNGSSQTLSAGQGFWMSAGASFLETDVQAVTLDGVATIGFKAWDAGADNGRLKYLGFPVEALARVRYQKVRFGAGLDYVLSPKVYGTGLFSSLDVPLKNSLGFAMTGDWVFRQPGANLGGFIGVRVVLESFETKSGGAKFNANAYGVQVGLDI